MNQAKVVPPLPSASVVVARNAKAGPELFMVRRRGGDAFGDSYAFPGGVVDDDDSQVADYCDGRSADAANGVLGVADGLAYYVAAIRELFEETGILLTTDGAGTDDLDDLRRRLVQKSVTWTQILREYELRMACDALHYFAHWETPIGPPKRWSTRFFLVVAPPGQRARHDGTEVTDSRWIPAAEALALGERGEWTLPYPTHRTLQALSEHDSVDELVAWARERVSQGVNKVRPVMIKDNGKTKILIPGDPGYPEDGGD